jgi:hypothetical protein
MMPDPAVVLLVTFLICVPCALLLYALIRGSRDE